MQPNMTKLVSLTLAVSAATAISVYAQEAPKAEEEKPDSILSERSPWLLAPVLNSNPKLGTTVGALGGYLHSFDAKSRPSIFLSAASIPILNQLSAVPSHGHRLMKTTNG